jgi:hypothetical protein
VYITGGSKSMQVIDVTEPANPKIVGSYRTNGRIRGIAVRDKYAYIVNDRIGMEVVDISNPDSPKHVATCKIRKILPQNICIVGNYAYLTAGKKGLIIIDISNPESPEVTGVYDTPGRSSDVCVVAGCAYIADGNHGLQIISIPYNRMDMATPEIGIKVEDISPLAITLTAPNGGEWWTGGVQEVITYNVSGGVAPYKVSLYYSTDGGRTYPNMIAANISQSSYTWTLPKIDFTTVRVKAVVTDSTGATSSDESDANLHIDSTAPQIISSIPSDGQKNVRKDTNITFHFNEPMNPGTVKEAFSITPDPGSKTYTWKNNNTILVVDLDELECNATYTCKIDTQATDASGAGNRLASAYVITFVTYDPRPKIKFISPAGKESWTHGTEHTIRWDIIPTGGITPPFVTDLYYRIKNEEYIIQKGIHSSNFGIVTFNWYIPYMKFLDDNEKVQIIAYVRDKNNNSSIKKSNSFEIDPISPAVDMARVKPTPGAVNVKLIDKIIIQFTEKMNTKSVEQALSIEPALKDVNYKWDARKKKLTISHAGFSYETTYTCTLKTDAKDISEPGNNLTREYKWYFTTLPWQIKTIGETDKMKYKSGEKVKIEVQLINKTPRRQTVKFNNKEYANFRIKDMSGNIVYTHYKEYTPKKTSIKINGGKCITIMKLVWDQKDDKGVLVKPGEYIIEIFLVDAQSRATVKEDDIVKIRIKQELDLTVISVTNKNEYEYSEGVDITVSVRNNSDTEVTLNFPDNQKSDFRITDKYGREVYLWSKDRYFPQVITSITLSPGETEVLLNYKWQQKDNDGNSVAPGVYELDGWLVKGLLSSHPEIHSERVKFKIKKKKRDSTTAIIIGCNKALPRGSISWAEDKSSDIY